MDILLKNFLIRFACGFDDLIAILVNGLFVLFRNLFDCVFRAQRFIQINDSLVLQHIDHATKGFLFSKRKLYRNRVRVQAGAHHLHASVVVRTRTVHLVDEGNSRHSILVGLPPNGFGLRLDPAHSAENGDGAVQNAKRSLDFGGEVDVTRRIDDVDAMVVPEASGGGGRYCNTALLLLLHPVHRGSAFVHFTNLVIDAGVIKDSLRGGGFAGIDVGHDADISCFFECYRTRHKLTTCSVRTLCSPPPFYGCLPSS